MPARTQSRAAMLRRVTIFAAIFVVASSLLLAQPTPLAAAAKPNIVVFYLDDVAPHDGRLWSDPQRTPAIYDTFIAHGLHFTHAYGEAPLCCPSRASVLSGLHTHNNGVNANDARLYVPQESVVNELTGAGYTTMWIGKYMNRNAYLSPQGWAAHMAPWSVFDGIYLGDHEQPFYDYTVRTKDAGDIDYGEVHSTQMIADRAVSRFAAAPADKPIFAMLSIYDMHAPNDPLPATPEQVAMCDNFAPWWTPAYNEADVSDKPAYIQATRTLPYPDGWPMQKYCLEMFGVDTAVKRVTDELASEGRLNNTLLIFTADNGMSWGAHRRGQQKNTPDATQLPLYMAWPAGWGSAPRDVNDYVSNIDLAPTFCDLGGCTLGPYPSGQSGPDGRSLVPLLSQGTALGRDAILEQSPIGDGGHIPGWASIRTTDQSGLGLWRYTQYADGERELYDEVNDPYELSNLASNDGYAGLEIVLGQRLEQLLNEGRVNRPDVSIWGKKNKKLYAGYNRFASAPTAAQTLSINATRGTTYSLRVDTRNNKVASDSFNLTASVTGSLDKVVIQWLLDGVDVTARMNAGGVQFQSVPGSVTRKLVLKVKVKRTFTKGSKTTFEIHAVSASDSSQDDHLTLILRR